jgi:glyoxylase-like metal-dependent hydrolase (beta-lactamase superfamily II)
MHTRQVGKQTFLVDVETGGLKNLISSYVLKGKKAVIVDSGPSSSIENLYSGLLELNVAPEDVEYVALTHVHTDHSSGVAALLEKLPNAKALVHRRGVSHLVDPSKLWAATKETLGYVADIFGEPKPVPENRIIVATEDTTIDVGEGVQLKVIDAPGHSAHNLCFFDKAKSHLFVGDSAGAYMCEFDVVVPTSPPPFRPDIALATLDKLIALNPQTLFYPHFGPANNGIQRLQTFAAQIKAWQRIAQENRSQGGTPETLCSRLFSEDPTIPESIRAPLLAAMEANPVHRKTLLENSVKGFFDFAQTLPP